MSVAIVTGSNGLIGSECVRRFCYMFDTVVGIDNDMRSYFFGPEASTIDIGKELSNRYDNYIQVSADIRSEEDLEPIFNFYNSDIELIVHTAAQPSHDWACKEPKTDFGINAIGTLNLLELYKQRCPEASFIFTSTNKVYGDRPNTLDLIELDTRYDTLDLSGVDESMSIDNCKHSIFGASKLAADIMVQEYGKYFGLNTVSFRGGCLTGGNHKSVKLHGFLSYLVKCVQNNEKYEIIGYKGKQVRDNIHSTDLVNAFLHYHKKPISGAVYNIGGGRDNSLSIIEAINLINKLCEKQWTNFTVTDKPRVGDHQWYITDFSKFKKDYNEWNISISLEDIIMDIMENSK
jgi:CDP-paratose 2-epimerase